MKKAIPTIMITAVALAVAAPAASAHKLPMYFVQDAAETKAFKWYLSDADATSYSVDWCWRGSPHKTGCRITVSGRRHGRISCTIYSCRSTDTVFKCHQYVLAWSAPGRSYKVFYPQRSVTCETQTQVGIY